MVRSLAVGTGASIYRSFKDLVEEVAQDTNASVYHAKFDSIEEKAEALQQWQPREPSYIVATSAFGMGMDHKAVRWGVYVGVRCSAIAQEVGRLGRDRAEGNR